MTHSRRGSGQATRAINWSRARPHLSQVVSARPPSDKTRPHLRSTAGCRAEMGDELSRTPARRARGLLIDRPTLTAISRTPCRSTSSDNRCARHAALLRELQQARDTLYLVGGSAEMTASRLTLTWHLPPTPVPSAQTPGLSVVWATGIDSTVGKTLRGDYSSYDRVSRSEVSAIASRAIWSAAYRPRTAVRHRHWASGLLIRRLAAPAGQHTGPVATTGGGCAPRGSTWIRCAAVARIAPNGVAVGRWDPSGTPT